MELVRDLRGDRPRVAVARRLGFRSNVLYTWEHGIRAPTAGDFLRLAEVRRPGIRRRLARFFGRSDDWLEAEPTEADLVAALLGELRGRRNVAELARAADATRLTVTRWLSGASQPRLPDLLRFIDAITQRLLEFVALFVDPATLPSTRDPWADLQSQLRVAYDLPWSHAVLRALEAVDYARLPRHRPGFVADLLGIALGEEERCLDALEQAHQIRWDGSRWTVTRVLAVDTARDPERNRQLKVHWAKVGLERLQGAGADEGFFSYNLFAISNARYGRIRELHAAYYKQLRALIAEEDQPERVVVTNLQLFSLDATEADAR